MDAKTRGAWIFHHASKLDAVVNRTDFDNIGLAGKAGVLLSVLSGQDGVTVPMPRVEALARTNNITKLELPGVLAKLHERKLVDLGTAGINVLGVSSTEVLSHTAASMCSLPLTSTDRSITLSRMGRKTRAQREQEREINEYIRSYELGYRFAVWWSRDGVRYGYKQFRTLAEAEAKRDAMIRKNEKPTPADYFDRQAHLVQLRVWIEQIACGDMTPISGSSRECVCDCVYAD
ncbi:MAG: hypothetical protein IPM54_10435 [Polyangiaceae bacterium]|nr:hypothetical protein [Polyangiaceae bacterium]